MPGFIIQKATNGGDKILDPNADSYISKTSSGFGAYDMGAAYSEITYRLFPQVSVELHSDLKTEGSTNFTDLMKDPWYAYFDGTNFLFRVRVGNNSAASKGFSVLIDADNTFAGSGTNPGFEYEVLLASNFDVRIINLKKNATTYTASYLSNSQRSVALSATNGNPDYFLDFFVPLTGFNGGITAATPLRLSGITVTSAQSGITGTVADIGGVNDIDYLDRYQIWNAVVNSFSPTSVNDILAGEFKPSQSEPPALTFPISTNDAVINGTSPESAGTLISVYQNNILIGTTTVTAARTWALAVTAGTLTLNSNITAQAKNGPEGLSNVSSAVVVSQVSCSSPPPIPVLGIIPANKKRIPVTIANTTTANFYLNIYRLTATGPVLVTTSPALTPGTTSWTYTGTLPTNGEHYADAVYVNDLNCISARSNSQCTGNSTRSLTAPTFSTTPITSATTSITITTTASTYNTLFADDVEIAEATASGTTLTYTNLALKSSQVLSVKISSDGSCGNTSAAVVVARVIPVITGSYCAVVGGSTITFTGTSPEKGSTIRLYNSANTQLTPTTTVNSNGIWSVTVSGITPGTYYARATAADGSGASANSANVTVTSQAVNTSLNISSPITGSTGSNGVVAGTAPANATVKVYIDGTLLGTTNVSATGSWSITGLAPLELYTGGLISASVITSGLCESAQKFPSGNVIPQPNDYVQCSIPPTAVAASFGPVANICNEGTVTATITNSERDVSYQITLNGVPTGYAKTGNGSTLVVTTGALTTGGTLRIAALKNYSAACQTILSATAALTIFAPAPAKPLISATTMVCFNSVATITVTGGLVAGDKYQLKKDGVLIGSEVLYTSGNLTFMTDAISMATSFTVVHKNTNSCTSTSNALLINTQSPSGLQRVTVNKNSICLNEPVIIWVATEYGGSTPYTYQVLQSLNGGKNTPVGTSFTGNGLVQQVTTPTLTTAGNYIYSVSVSARSCTVSLAQTQNVSVGQTVTVASVGPAQTACYSTNLNGNHPAAGTGTWTLESKPLNAPPPIFANVNQYNSLVVGLTSGSYVFRWTISQTCASGSTTSTAALLAVTANCPTAYNVNSPYFVNGYDNQDVIAFAYDSEGFTPKNASNFSLLSESFPPGVSLNTATGEIFVSNSSTLSLYKGPDYNFNLTITATDALNNTTVNIPITLTFYPEASPAFVSNNQYTVLPVVLLYFRANQINGQVELRWATAMEKDSKAFVIEKSAEGKLFRKISEVAGAGNILQEQKYLFRDREALAGTAYYRLKQVDFAGTYTYSPVVTVKALVSTNQQKLLVYPNPTNGKIAVELEIPDTEDYTMEVWDLAGKPLLAEKAFLKTQTAEITLNLQFLPAGTYLVRARSENNILVTRIIRN